MSGTATLTAPVAARHGTAYYVPEVRISTLDRELKGGREPGNLLPADVLGDLVHAEVTRVNTGASQYTLTFNNWFLSTAADRQRQGDAGSGGPRETIDPDNAARSPFWPRFKYNDFSYLCFGDRLRVEMRYVPEPTAQSESPDAPETSSGGWTPMVSGPITDIRFAFATGQGAQITVSGEDDLSDLKEKHEGKVTMNRRPEIDIVRQTLSKVDYKLPLATPLVDYEPFMTDGNQGINETLADGQAPLDLIQKLADRLDFEIFVEFSDLDDPAAPLEIHFEPYRGRAKPVENLRPLFLLDRDRNLLDFNPTIKLADQYARVVVKGRHRDPLLAKEVKGEGTGEIVREELHIDPALDFPLMTGPELREEWFGRGGHNFSIPNQSNLDDVRADWAAKSAIRKKARELFTIEATTLGIPRIRPGRHLEIRGMRAPFDGFYYVTKTVHTLGTDGYRTRITACRPGMEFPPYVVRRKGASA